MNLRKTILYFVLVLFAILMYASFMSFTIVSQVASDLGITTNALLGSGNAFIIWMQFPLILLISIVIIYLIFAEDSLTKQSLKK
jgi:hypothetical protein